ncbi:hypothetical protein [Micromonospora psammae]|uniref:hypothetical protein n=1 Tax=Micromonospora sp. CPCC 205556 TaxID=3122398 RepID=UPI002FF3CCC7
MPEDRGAFLLLTPAMRDPGRGGLCRLVRAGHGGDRGDRRGLPRRPLSVSKVVDVALVIGGVVVLDLGGAH